MSQAKTLSNHDLNKVLTHVANTKHGARNRLAVLLTYHIALRASEVASLTIRHVMNDDHTVKDELRLTADIVKERRDSAVPLGKKIREEIAQYLTGVDMSDLDKPLIYSQKGGKGWRGFNAGTIAQLLGQIYKDAGVVGATSHSGRRTLITRLAGRGVSVRVLQKIARHQNISTTQCYIDCNDDMVRKAVDML